jgi:hypothetical protein
MSLDEDTRLNSTWKEFEKLFSTQDDENTRLIKRRAQEEG